MDTFLQKTEELRAAFEAVLTRYLRELRVRPDVLSDSMRYSLNAGGKRIRPVLMFASAQMLGGKVQDVENLALALEMIHTYSLIHDDLPAMDDDDFRRGKPSCHKVFGEGQAILAGDALLNEAYSLCFEECGKGKTYLAAARVLCGNAGALGLVAGQAADLFYAGKEAGQAEAEFIMLNKTAKMIQSAVTVPAYVYGADENIIAILGEYGKNLGCLFQITDDLLDVKGSFEQLGKTAGKDAKENKLSAVALLGEEGAEALADKYCAICLKLLGELPYECSCLEEMTRAVRAREK